MITPLGQRQIFQAANLEAIRAAHEVGEQLQREAVRRKAADDRLAEDQETVNRVTPGQAMRAEERKEHRKGGREAGGPSGEAHDEAEGTVDPAAPAESRLDFLA